VHAAQPFVVCFGRVRTEKHVSSTARRKLSGRNLLPALLYTC
jgi:hypothetical protein